MTTAGAYIKACRDFFAALDDPQVTYQTLQVGQRFMSKECFYMFRNHGVDPVQYQIERIDIQNDQIEYSVWYQNRQVRTDTESLSDFNYRLNNY